MDFGKHMVQRKSMDTVTQQTFLQVSIHSLNGFETFVEASMLHALCNDSKFRKEKKMLKQGVHTENWEKQNTPKI